MPVVDWALKITQTGEHLTFPWQVLAKINTYRDFTVWRERFRRLGTVVGSVMCAGKEVESEMQHCWMCERGTWTSKPLRERLASFACRNAVCTKTAVTRGRVVSAITVGADCKLCASNCPPQFNILFTDSVSLILPTSSFYYQPLPTHFFLIIYTYN